jgi:hypothetical protein
MSEALTVLYDVNLVSNTRARVDLDPTHVLPRAGLDILPSPPSSISPMDTLPPLERAVFSTASRLLSCTVTESLTRAIYIPVAPFGLDARALAVVLTSDASNKPPAVIATYKLEDILAVVPLKHVPIFKQDTSNPYALDIGLLDPMDMSPNVFVVDRGAANGGETGTENV